MRSMQCGPDGVRKNLKAWWLLSWLIGCWGAQPLLAQVQQMPLESGWEFRQMGAEDAKWLPATVPGDVHLDLLKNKLIPDPFYRDNESKLQWIEDASWSYRKTLTAAPEILGRQHVELVFEGLNTTAQVHLNGQLILSVDNMFRPWRIDVKPYLRAGDNQIEIDFPSEIKTAKDLAAADPLRKETNIPERSYLRKATYEYGWDWGPKFVTSGIWRPVRLESWDQARIENVAIREPDVHAEVAHLVAQVNVAGYADVEAQVVVRYGLPGQPEASKTIETTLHAGENQVSVPIDIQKPALWFPAGYGGQPLYSFTATVKVGGKAEDEKTVRTGLRSVVLHRERDQWGRSFYFIVNGIPIFAKGADVIPFDSFPNRVTEERYRQILGSARDANMNMIRLWGGGYYESDMFYQICDELGLMVWQDFMFASSWYPGSVEYKQNVEQEAAYQVERLRNHPSMTLWSGNNEVESVLNGYLGKESTEGKLRIWNNYLTIFSGILPNVVQREDPEVPYWPSSPSADYEPTSDAFQSGDAHDWSIWHGREPFKNYENHFYRFNSEYGFQSFPELRTVESFTTAEDRANIFTPVMLAHQKNNEGNSIIHEYLLRDYAEPKDFASFLYMSQVLQAEGVKVGAEHMRRNRPRITGSLFWQLNDCWPVASWSSIDSFGRWKALQYYARRFYNPLLVSPTLRDGEVVVYGVSDKVEPTPATLRARVMTMDGRVVKELTQTATLPPLSSGVYMKLPLQSIVEQAKDLSQVFVVTDMTVAGQQVSRNLIYLEPTKTVQLIPAKLTYKLTKAGDSYTLQVSSPVLARDVYASFGNLDVQFSDNYINILPGETAQLTVRSSAPLAELTKQMQVVSLTDAFPPKSQQAVASANVPHRSTKETRAQ